MVTIEKLGYVHIIIYIQFVNSRAQYTCQPAHLHVPWIEKDLNMIYSSYGGAVIWNDILKYDIKINESENVFCDDIKSKLLQGV